MNINTPANASTATFHTTAHPPTTRQLMERLCLDAGLSPEWAEPFTTSGLDPATAGRLMLALNAAAGARGVKSTTAREALTRLALDVFGEDRPRSAQQLANAVPQAVIKMLLEPWLPARPNCGLSLRRPPPAQRLTKGSASAFSQSSQASSTPSSRTGNHSASLAPAASRPSSHDDTAAT